MSRRRLLLGAAIMLAILHSLFAVAAQPDRIQGPIDDRARASIRGNVRALAGAPDLGAVEPTLSLPRITMYFNRTPAQEIALQELMREQQDPSSPNYHKWLTPEQYGERFGISDADMAKVADWLQVHGFKLVEQPRSRTYIAFSGTAGQAQNAFATQLRRYSVHGEVHVANAAEPSLPVAIATVVTGFRGLDDFRPKSRATRTRPKFTSTISGNHFLTPDDFATIYDLKPLYNNGVDGTGQWVGVMGQTNIVQADIATFRNLSGLPANAPVVIQIPGSNTAISSNDIGEADLDVEWSGAVARNATVVYVNAGTGPNLNVFDSLTYAINTQVTVNGTTKLIPVLSISYGACEDPSAPNSAGWPTAQLNSLETTLQQASTQGQTVVGPGGDAGATDCESTTAVNATDGLWVDFPASSPFVTGIGGTMFNGAGDPNNTTDTCPNNAPCWSLGNNSANGSVLMYISEKPWNETLTNPNTNVPANSNCAVGLNCILVGGGGGLSALFTKPAYQAALTPNDGKRDVPDVSLAAAFIHDGYLTCTSNQTPADCTNGFRDSNNNLDAVGGTSAGAPTFAGMVALLNQMLANQNKPVVGFLNPALYALAGSSTDAFHDITTGDNKMPCRQGTPDCPNGGFIGYSAGPGYDLASGLGSVDGYNLVSELATGTTSTAPAPDFTIAATGATTIALPHGTQMQVNVALTGLNGFNGTVNFTCIVPAALAGVTCTPPGPMSSPYTNTNFTITASSTARLAEPAGPPTYLAWTGGGAALAGAFLLIGASDPRRRATKGKLLSSTVLLATALLLVALSGCGGGSSGGGGGGNPTPTPTPHAESGVVVLQGTNNANIHMVAITVNVN